MNLTDLLYRLARASATGRAARRGPAALGRRMVRRQVYRATNRATANALRRWGL